MLDYRSAAAILEEKQRQAQKRDGGAESDIELGVRWRRLTVAVAATLALVLVFANDPSGTSTRDIADKPEVVVVSETEIAPRDNSDLLKVPGQPFMAE